MKTRSHVRWMRLVCLGPLMAMEAMAGAPARANDAKKMAEKVIAQSVAAQGGKGRIAGIPSIKFEGTIEAVPGASGGSFTLLGKPARHIYEEWNTAAGQMAEGSNGISLWRRSGEGAATTLRGWEAAQLALTARLLNGGLVNLKKQNLRAEWVGEEKVNGRAAIDIRLEAPPGVVRELYFDKQTHLLVRQKIPAHGAIAEREMDYSDYRPTSGVLEPFALTERNGSEEMRVAMSSVTVGAPVTETVFEFPRALGAALPDAASLFREVQRNQKNIEELVKTYTYKETDEEEENEPEKGGGTKPKSVEEYEVFYLSGKRIQRLIAKDGKPLRAEASRKEDARVDKEVASYKKEQAKETDASRKKQADEDEAQISKFLKVEKFFNPRRELFRGEEVIVYDFEGDPGYKPKGPVENLIHSLAGTVWIDPQAKDVVRLEARLNTAVKFGGGVFASLQKDSGFVFEQQRVNNEVWLPSMSEAHFSGRVLLFKGFKANEVDRFSDYKKFTVDVKILPNLPAPHAPGPAVAAKPR